MNEFKKVKDAQEKITDFVCNQVGISTMHPNLDPKDWPPPYGQNTVAPLEHVIRQPFDKITESDDTLLQSYERTINHGQIHKCFRQYCLKDLGKKPKDDKSKKEDKKQLKVMDQAKDVTEIDGRIYSCRFGYPEQLCGYTYYAW